MIAIYGAIGFYCLPMAAFQAELTRLGMVPESQFGWTKPQPAIDPALMQQSSWHEADVLVVGDSFSEGRVWQTILTQAGLHVRTEHWDSVRGVCEDFMPWLQKQGFRGKYVVFEAIERNVVNDTEKWGACQHMMFHTSIYADTPRTPPIVSFDPNEGHYLGRFSIGILTKINAWKYTQASNTPGFSGLNLTNGVNLLRIKNGCDLFSHANCNDSLFLTKDQAADLPDSVIDHMEKFNARIPGIVPIWVVVPNKSTAYLYPDKQFWNKAEHRLNAPNILRTFHQAIDAKMVDLYPANNSHVSTQGYLLMGEAIYQYMQQIEARKNQ